MIILVLQQWIFSIDTKIDAKSFTMTDLFTQSYQFYSLVAIVVVRAR